MAFLKFVFLLLLVIPFAALVLFIVDKLLNQMPTEPVENHKRVKRSKYVNRNSESSAETYSRERHGNGYEYGRAYESENPYRRKEREPEAKDNRNSSVNKNRYESLNPFGENSTFGKRPPGVKYENGSRTFFNSTYDAEKEDPYSPKKQSKRKRRKARRDSRKSREKQGR